MNESWFRKLFTEDNILIFFPAILIVLLIAGFFVYGVQEPPRYNVSTSRTLLDNQIIYESDLFQDFEAGTYTATDPYVIVNPYKVSPLTALLMFETTEAQKFVVVVKGKTAEADLVYETDESIEHFIPIYGLYADYQNTIELYEYDYDLQIKGDLISTTLLSTGPLPTQLKTPTSMDTTYTYFLDDWMLLTPATNNLPVAIDAFGDVRWYFSEPLAFAMKPLENGHFMVGSNRIMSSPYYTTSLFEIDFLGKIYTEFYIPGGYHHDFVELANGNLLVLSNDFNGTVEDIVVEIDRTTGEVVETWDIGDYLDPLEGMSQMWTTSDWFHNNSIDYNPATDSILLSGRHQDVVISIGYTSKELEYVIGDPLHWSLETVENYFLTPTGSPFEWSYAQHSAIYLPNGDIFLFDNGNNRSKDSDHYVTANNNYSRGVIYRVNQSKMEISQIYQFGKNLGNNFYSPYISNIAYYGENHYLIHSGGIASTLEGALNIPAPLYDGELEVSKRSVTIEVLEGDIKYRLEMPDHYYRAIRVNPTANTEFSFASGVRLGQQMITPVYVGAIDYKVTIFPNIPVKYEVNFVKESDRLVIDGVFTQGDLIYAVLSNSSTEILYHIPTSQTAFTAMCTAIFEGDDRFVTYYINEENLSGTYEVYLVINGHKYDSNKQVVFK